jgi:methylenetetrahydrofolate reductase (NADPH)
MIDIHHNLQLKHLLDDKEFPLGVELVSTRGALSEKRVRKVADYGEALAHHPEVDWVSITDNAGGHPQLAPIALGTPILYRGKEVIIHLTCKDLNRNSIESQLWLMASHGFQNVLALTGDYPHLGDQGRAKPVFDLDSVSLLSKIKEMNLGLKIPTAKLLNRRIDATTFFAGAVVSPYKRSERTLLPQMLKMEEKLRQSAGFLISQIGYDGRRAQELLMYLKEIGQTEVPVIANVYVLSKPVIELFASGKIPGVAIPPKMLELFRAKSQSPDNGKAFFLEFAAQQLVYFKNIGYRAGYVGGVSNTDDLDRILGHVKIYSREDILGNLKVFSEHYDAGEDGTYLYENCGPQVDILHTSNQAQRQILSSAPRNLSYAFTKKIHHLCFNHQHPITKSLVVLSKKATRSQAMNNILHCVEKMSKSMVFGCKDCGDCSLPETAFLCPEASCAKNMRNGPCGGSLGDRCEVYDYECIWARAYDRRKLDLKSETLLHHAPVIQNHSLRGTSGWMNYWQKKDHQFQPEEK